METHIRFTIDLTIDSKCLPKQKESEELISLALRHLSDYGINWTKLVIACTDYKQGD